MKANEQQKMVCSIALFADGWSPRQIGDALGVDESTAQELIEKGANAQADQEMGRMLKFNEAWSGGPESRQ